jgi:hypothetical protein
LKITVLFIPILIFSVIGYCWNAPNSNNTPTTAFICSGKNLEPSQLESFKKDDSILILVTGFANQSRQFGYSGKSSLYKAVGNSTSHQLRFLPVTNSQNVECERNSTVDPLNKRNYGKDGYIPPGIYFLHYHRFHITPSQRRHRLTLSDHKCAENIQVKIGNDTIQRVGIQLHVAHTNMEMFKEDVSEGCITFSEENFFKLLPQTFFIEDSPLNTCANHTLPTRYSGNGNILVFVTDPTDEILQNNQIKIFNEIESGGTNGLKTSDFSSPITSKLKNLRAIWKAGTL